MSPFFLAIIATGLLALSCSSSSDATASLQGGNESAGSAGDAGADEGKAGETGDGGSAGAHGWGSTGCNDDSKLVLPVEPERGCLQTDQPMSVGCRAGGYGDRYPCYRRISDGLTVWSTDVSLLSVDPQVWAPCGFDPGQLPPPACFAASCAQSPISGCSEAFTRDKFACGSRRSPWDAGCCRRAECLSDADCGEDEDCVTQDVDPHYECWPIQIEPFCDCASRSGLGKTVCVKKSDPP